MPLVRFELRNEYGLGAQNLYQAKEIQDEPKAVLEGVAVAGLVGILRQLGDLAEFAADVFHDLQEQVVATATRSHKMIVRVQSMEATLPQLEKVILSQSSHIHFAYTAGCDWHPKIRAKQKYLSRSDLPSFILDSYEECRDPPCLHLLDKFDTSGPGACLKRYSDPSFFRKAMTSSGNLTAVKEQRHKKSLTSKKKPSRRRNGHVSRAASMSQCSSSFQFTSPRSYGQSSVGETISATHMRSNSELGELPTSFDSRSRSRYIECIFDVSTSMQYEDQEHSRLQASMLQVQPDVATDSIYGDEQEKATFDNLAQGTFQASNSSSVTWDEKTEIVKPENHQTDNAIEDVDESTELIPAIADRVQVECKDTILVHFSPEDVMIAGDNPSDPVCEAAELSTSIAYQVKDEDKDTVCGTVDLQGVMFAGEDSSVPCSQGYQFDEAGSETDRYMDALNTLESEAEMDSECQTKQEVRHPLANFKNEEIESGPGVMHEMTTVNSELSHVEFEAESPSLSNKQMSQSFSNLVSSEDLICACPPEVTGTSSDPEVSVRTDCHVNTGLIGVSRVDCCEYSMDNLQSSSSRHPNLHPSMSDKNISSLYESEESGQESLDGTSVKVWTNGGLLGLEPSKPPDCSALKVETITSVAQAEDTESHSLSSSIDVPDSHPNGSLHKVDAFKTHEQIDKNLRPVEGIDRSPDIVSHNDLYLDQWLRRTRNIVQKVDNSKYSTLYHDKKDNDVPGKKSLEPVSSVSEPSFEKSEDLCLSISLTNAHMHDMSEIGLVTSQVGQPVILGVQTQTREASHEVIQGSSSMGLGQKLFVNGFHGDGSLFHDDTSQLRCSADTGLLNLKESRDIPRTGIRKVTHHLSPGKSLYEQLETGSPVSSLSCSPPLEHMKISFHPLDSFETSKLKLKFPGVHHFHESIKDAMFPSFQLLPEHATPLQYMDSESEDDTFYRSSLCTSEEHVSHHSASSSEQWKSGEITVSKDHEIYDTLRRVSSVESISSSVELDPIDHDSILHDNNFRSSDTNNGFNRYHCDPLFDLPSFDTVTSSSEQDRVCADPKDNKGLILQYPNVPVPSPPPLPPVGWRMTKPNLDQAETQQVVITKSVNNPKDLQVLGANISQQSSASPQMQPNVKEVTACLLKNKDQLKLYESEEAGNPANGKEMVERENFLHQIRSKSFSLRRTLPPARPTLIPPTTDTKVAAILEKANAIRQAYVGSDEGGDDNWSDGSFQ